MSRLDTTTSLKTCSKCRVPKGVSHFGQNKQAADGLTHYCKTCLAEIRAARKATRHDETNAYYRQYYAQHRQTHLARVKSWSQRNSLKRLAISRKWYETDRNRTRTLRTSLRYTRRGRQSAALQDGSVTRKTVRELMATWTGTCPKCHKVADPTIDHIVALAKGGSHTLSNFQLLCKSCNSSKGAR